MKTDCLDNEDFEDDTKDAGELGVGHSVTALYELVLKEGQQTPKSMNKPNEIKLLYQEKQLTSLAKKSKELGQINFRYKQPEGDKSKLITHKLSRKINRKKVPSINFQFSAAVAGFGLIVRQSAYNKVLDVDKVQNLAQSAIGKDKYGYLAEFLKLVAAYKAKELKVKPASGVNDF